LKRVVIVDDNDLVRESTGAFFQNAGWSVALAAGPAEAQACVSEPFDAMICDLNLASGEPDDGLHVLAAARRAAPRAVLVLLSGSGDPASDLGELQLDAVVRKPVRLARLEKLIVELVAR
jgi:two-component system C4-dicarboxylate transport response regulator DctD